MAETKKIKTALVSVFHKDGLDELLAKLNAEGVKFLSTGGTQKFIESQYEIPGIDLVIVDLYPFEQTVASGASEADIIEKIDIGGISLIRAGAKNFKDVVIVPSKAEYGVLLDILNKKGAETDIEDRKMFAARAFGVSSHYDTAIHEWFVK